MLGIGGSGADPSLSRDVQKALQQSMLALAEGSKPLAAVTRAVAALEDDGAFNAGRGSALRQDGLSILMDAMVWDSSGNFGAVTNLGLVRNPVKVALDVANSQLAMMGGPGATSFARAHGHPAFDAWSSRAQRQWEVASMADAGRERDGEGASDSQHSSVNTIAYHNAAVVLRTAEGQFAGAASGGGSSLALPGEIGAAGIPGAALFVGQNGAVAISGPSPLLLRIQLARAVYEQMIESQSTTQAVVYGLEATPKDTTLAIVAVDRDTFRMGSRGPVAWGFLPSAPNTPTPIQASEP
ncbi:MAG TPA: isoaspartyl peptidase/L-asparaginase [Polyangiaceae bacterium]|nr:MAG: N(4)-(Beta-N-acetylglucosaminyl)-L-asparaginase precursor [Deltaproteobacteria bacterium ADurb.Bin207]HNS97232.1 isoaspartyl peptidase/L-asparaginase [Polyangiaceae bacterium]HNZ23110.1 isoaspartyl peptidase/L-asparaginase [Polyangiaceae bacterium]HOD22160.1 isoaspartyl peptidase/L-asparaginase [Polyangiaceae bacterium]HOE49391.1 isoaspartyl peptidase/L-asparaginase [Polyangiaceae bacterium]